MFSAYRLSLPLLTGITLALSGPAAHAAVVSYIGAQGPKPDLLNNIPPPALGPAVSNAQLNFTQKVTELGRNEFEATSALGFSYTGGAAAFSGGAGRVVGSASTTDLGLGRYNMTTGLPLDAFGEVNRGNWVEAMSNFRVDFTGTSVTAFSFFATDLGDFDGTVTLEIFGGANNGLLFSQLLQNDVGVTLNTDGSRNTAGANGNLLYFGVTSNIASDYFRSVRFTITQGGPGDVVGFDSFTVGQYSGATTPPSIPEPGSLALAGFALLAAGAARRARAAT